jgi:hypothetical protein
MVLIMQKLNKKPMIKKLNMEHGEKMNPEKMLLVKEGKKKMMRKKKYGHIKIINHLRMNNLNNNHKPWKKSLILKIRAVQNINISMVIFKRLLDLMAVFMEEINIEQDFLH